MRRRGEATCLLSMCLSTPELDPFPETVVAWCRNNVCEGMVMCVSYVRREISHAGVSQVDTDGSAQKLSSLCLAPVIMLSPETFPNILKSYFFL